jgi:hypothetical protein
MVHNKTIQVLRAREVAYMYVSQNLNKNKM